MRVTVCQLASSRDSAVNRALAVTVVTDALGAGADLVVLPEAMLCSFGHPEDPLAAEPLDGPFTRALCDALAFTEAAVVVGTFEPTAEPATRGPGTKVHNTVVVLGAGGVLARYRKLHLYDALGWCESDRVVAGDPVADGVAVTEVGGLRIGVLTCYDLRFPEVARALVDRGAEVLVVPASWVAGPGKIEQWRIMAQARAMENTCYLCGSGQPGPDYSGTSLVVDPRGAVMEELPAEGSGTITAALDPATLRQVRRSLPLLESRRFEVRPRALDGTVERPADGA